ncbi:hypothetical protein SALBM311S_02889 [Streptomyces alboniger]
MAEGRLTVRKAWIVGAALGAGLGFVMLLVVGVYLVAGNLANEVGGGTKTLAKGAVPAAYRELVQKRATSALPSIRRCSPLSSTRRAGSTRRPRARRPPRG